MIVKTNRLPLTQFRVGDLALWAEALTGIEGWVGERTYSADGVTWTSKVKPHVWRGLRANHLLASYLLGVIEASKSGRLKMADPQHDINGIKALVSIDPVWRGMGKLDGAQLIAKAKSEGGRASRAVMTAGAV